MNTTQLVSFHSSKVEIRAAGAKGIGLFACSPIQDGELLVITGGRILTTQQFETFSHGNLPFQVETFAHIAPVYPERPDGMFAVNHSCAPTAGLSGQLSLVALRALQADEEITYDYVMTDSDADGITPFIMKCLCGVTGCRGIITDRDWRQPELRERYRGYFSSYLQKRF